MAVTAKLVIETVAHDLGDLDHIHWTIDSLCRWLNAGQHDAVSRRPDLTATRAAKSLSAGVVQSLPADAVGLLDVPRNTSGTKRAIRKVDRDLLDRFQPGWPAFSGVTEIRHYCYDPRDPLKFEVYPPAASSGASVDLVYTAKPADIAVVTPPSTFENVAGNIGLPDWTWPALVAYIKYRAYSREGEPTSSQPLAAAQLAAYADILGVQITAALAAAPANKT